MTENKEALLINEILEWANSNKTKSQSVNDLGHYLFKINEAKQAREKNIEIESRWNEWKKEKIDIIINGIK